MIRPFFNNRGDRLSSALLAALLALVMVLPRLTTAFFLLTVLVGLGALRLRDKPLRFVEEARRGWKSIAPFGWAAIAYLGLNLLQFALGMAESGVVERTVLGVAALAWALSGSPTRAGDIRVLLLPAAAIGTLGGAAYAAFQVFVQGAERAYGGLGIGPIGNGAIKFGDLAVLLSLLSLVLVVDARGARDRWFGFVGLVGGMTIVALSGSRGALIGFALAAAGLALATWQGRSRAARSRAALGPGPVDVGAAAPLPARAPGVARAGAGASRTVAVVVVLLLSITTIALSARFAEIGGQIQQYEAGEAVNPTGQRLALWTAALRSVPHAPLLGVGVNRFDLEIERQVLTGQVPDGMKILYRHVHNEYLCAWATLGIGGLLSLTAMFVLPIFVSARRIARGRRDAATHAGLVVSIAFAGFALTDCLFDRQITFVVFFLLTAWLMRIGDVDTLQEAAGPDLVARQQR